MIAFINFSLREKELQHHQMHLPNSLLLFQLFFKKNQTKLFENL